MSIGAKLQVKPGMRVTVIGAPESVDLELPEGVSLVEDGALSDAVIAFVTNASALDTVGEPALEAARNDRIAWLAYPKAGQLDTDLNRDVLARLAGERGVRPVRQVAVDAVWSALRFRP